MDSLALGNKYRLKKYEGGIFELMEDGSLNKDTLTLRTCILQVLGWRSHRSKIFIIVLTENKHIVFI